MPWETENSECSETSFSTIKEADILSEFPELLENWNSTEKCLLCQRAWQVGKVFKGNCSDFQLSILRHLSVPHGVLPNE